MSRFTLSRRLAVSFLLLAFPSLLHSQTAPNEPSSLRPDYMTYYIGDNHGTGNGFNKGYYKEKLKGGDLEYAGYLACDLAIAYLDGVDGNKKIKPNEQEALKWLQNIPLSAMKKQPCDYGHIGYRLLGQGKPAIPANPAEAERWLTIAATSDIYTREPRYNLGVAYLRGDIIPRDNAKAVHFIKQASDEHLSWAMILYAELLTEGKLVPQNLNQAQRLLTMAKAHAESEEDAYQSELQQKGELDAELARMDAQHHAEMLGVISQGLANMANVAATPTATQTASNQAQANIAAAGAQDQALAAQRALEKRSPPASRHSLSQANTLLWSQHARLLRHSSAAYRLRYHYINARHDRAVHLSGVGLCSRCHDPERGHRRRCPLYSRPTYRFCTHHSDRRYTSWHRRISHRTAALLVYRADLRQ